MCWKTSLKYKSLSYPWIRSPVSIGIYWISMNMIIPSIIVNITTSFSSAMIIIIVAVFIVCIFWITALVNTIPATSFRIEIWKNSLKITYCKRNVSCYFYIDRFWVIKKSMKITIAVLTFNGPIYVQTFMSIFNFLGDRSKSTDLLIDLCILWVTTQINRNLWIILLMMQTIVYDRICITTCILAIPAL